MRPAASRQLWCLGHTLHFLLAASPLSSSEKRPFRDEGSLFTLLADRLPFLLTQLPQCHRRRCLQHLPQDLPNVQSASTEPRQSLFGTSCSERFRALRPSAMLGKIGAKSPRC